MGKPAIMSKAFVRLTLASLAIAFFALSPLTSAYAQLPWFMSENDERKIGAEQHPKIMEEFGGPYSDPKLSGYVAQIAGRVAINSPMNANELKFVVLNTAVVNAMALPGGYVYATRGLMALANSEAELAGVLAHEVGHVVARHAAKRYNKATTLGIGGTIASILLGQPGFDQLFNVGGTLWLLKNSRDDEYEADALGTSYIRKTGYDPYAMSSFLTTLDLQNKLNSALAGKGYVSNRVDYTSTHPNTVDRVQRARRIAQQTGVAEGTLPRRHDEYLNAIDGMLYGDDPDQGYVRGHTFSHPTLKFTFTVPNGFNLRNSAAAVTALGPNKAQIRFNFGRNSTGGDMARHLSNWAKGQRLQDVKSGPINGMNGAAAIITNVKTDAGQMDARLYAIAFSSTQVAQFMILTPRNMTNQTANVMWTMANSFRRIGNSEIKKLKPHRIKIIIVRGGDTAEGLANRLPYSDYRLERFLTLNGMTKGQTLRAGSRVKIITE